MKNTKDTQVFKITKDTQVSLEELAAVTRLTKSWLNQLAADGYFKRESHGRYRLSDAITGLLKHAKEERRNAKPSPAHERVLMARAEAIEHKNKLARREIITMEDHTLVIDMIIGPTVAFLNGLPAQLTRDRALQQQYEKTIDGGRRQLCEKWKQMASDVDKIHEDDEDDDQ